MNLRFMEMRRSTSSVTFFIEAIFSISWSVSLDDPSTARATSLFESRISNRRSSMFPVSAILIFSEGANWFIFRGEFSFSPPFFPRPDVPD